MSGARLLKTSLRCQNCQWQSLSTFASLAGVSLNPARPAIQRRLPAAIPRLSYTPATRRQYATRDDIKSTEASEAENEILRNLVGEEDVKEVENEPASSQVTSSSQDRTIPWYLQGDQEEQRPITLAERQKLPELPDDAPENLGAIVEHLFTDIGLDDLRILDLRKMDPPQALGANLIMMFGTARSERHLHTSADRFCRWLRSNYKLRPYADGLLGRNELKIRLRRKAKRAKLLGGKGIQENEADDGIRTGWVCVNVGAIEKGEEVTAADLQAQGIIGFGEGIAGANLVVQMMTEEKREDLNLEKLWMDARSRQERKEARMDQELENEALASKSERRATAG